MKNDGIISNLIWKFAERIAAQSISLIVSIILARILIPDDYGTVSLIMVFITIADVFVNNGLGTALIQKKYADQLDYSSTLWANMILSVIIYLIIYIAAPYISAFYNQELTLIIRVLALRIIVAGFNSIQHAYVSKNMLFRKYFWSTLFGTLVSGIVGVFLAYSGAGPWALVMQYMTNSCIDTVVLFFTVGWRPKLFFSFSRVLPLIKYGWSILVEAFSDTLVSQLRNLIIGKVYSPSDLAYYTKGQQFPNLFMANISTSISSVLFPAMSNRNNDKSSVTNLMRKSIRLMTFVLFPILLGFSMIARPFVRIVLTEKWINAVPYLQLFCIAFLLQVGMNPRHEAIKAIGCSKVYMNEHILYRAIDIVLLLLVLKKGVIYILICYIFSLSILSIILAYTSKKYTDYTYKDQIYDVIKPIICSILMCFILYYVSKLKLNDYFLILIEIIVGIISYTIFALLLKIPELSFIIMKVRAICEKRK